MPDTTPKTMRDIFIERIHKEMIRNDRIFFLSADFGAPALDKIRSDFGSRFVNVGIAEQNLVNVAVGLALEGYCVYAYAIAGFLSMRAYEQIRTNISLFAQQRTLNINLVGVGGGVSYDMAGPSHHCLEDLSIMRTLPNIDLYCPADWITAQLLAAHSVQSQKPKYIRLEGKPVGNIYENETMIDWKKGFHELNQGEGLCIISCGYMTHRAVKIVRELQKQGRSVGLVDIFKLNPLDTEALFETLKNYSQLISIEEGFIHKGGLDSMLLTLLNQRNARIPLKCFGFEDKYVCSTVSRERLYAMNGFSDSDIICAINKI